MRWTRVLMGCWAAAAMATCPIARGANCALRNPDRRIYAMCPKATSYRSVVANVDVDKKPVIEKVLRSPLVFSDLGKHTVYVVLKKGVPIGFVHARSEVGRRGLLELVWTLDLDLRISDFWVQRGRERHMAVIKAPAFRDRLVGRGLEELRALLTSNNTAVDTSALKAPPRAAGICHTVVLSALKTRIITEVAFSDFVLKARLLGNTHRFFPATAKVTKVPTPFDKQAVAALKKLTGPAPKQIQRDSLTVLRASDKSGKTVGILVYTRWATVKHRPQVWLAVSAGGVIQKAILTGQIGPEMKKNFADLKGKDLDQLLKLQKQAADKTRKKPHPKGAKTPPKQVDKNTLRCGVEVLAILRAHGIVN